MSTPFASLEVMDKKVPWRKADCKTAEELAAFRARRCAYARVARSKNPGRDAAYNRLMRKKYPEKTKERDKVRASELKTQRREKPALQLFMDARRRARDNGIEFDITPDDIVVPTRCPLLGLELGASDGRPTASSPSLDRIDNRVGYVKGNVWVISHKANTCKNSLSLNELETFASNALALLSKLNSGGSS